MTLSEYIQNLGDEAAAHLFDMKIRTIRSWRRHERYPRPAQAQMIIERTGGKVSYAGIYGERAA